jgi:P-type conjugative transfer protein TrbJ
MCKRISALAVGALLAVDNTPRLDAGAFATELTQLLNHGQLVMQYIRQGEQLANEIRMYEDMLRNVKPLGGQVYGPIMADINSLSSIVQGGMALAYSMANLDAQFRTRYPGYATSPNAYYRDYRVWSQTTLDTTLGALRAAGLQGQQLRSEQAILDSIRSMAQGSDGRMQALQVLGQISEQQVQQLMKLRALMLADLSSKQAYQATVVQRQAASEAATEHFFNWSPEASDGRTYQAGWK